MGINISHMSNGHQFENRERQKAVLKEIFGEDEKSEETVQNIADRIIPNYTENGAKCTLSIIKAASQISVNDSLKETLKYLKSCPITKSHKTHVLGELWDMFTSEQYEANDVINFEIDFSATNIFAA